MWRSCKTYKTNCHTSIILRPLAVPTCTTTHTHAQNHSLFSGWLITLAMMSFYSSWKNTSIALVHRHNLVCDWWEVVMQLHKVGYAKEKKRKTLHVFLCSTNVKYIISEFNLYILNNSVSQKCHCLLNLVSFQTWMANVLPWHIQKRENSFKISPFVFCGNIVEYSHRRLAWVHDDLIFCQTIPLFLQTLKYILFLMVSCQCLWYNCQSYYHKGVQCFYSAKQSC